jgi:hypothetical protein
VPQIRQGGKHQLLLGGDVAGQKKTNKNDFIFKVHCFSKS